MEVTALAGYTLNPTTTSSTTAAGDGINVSKQLTSVVDSNENYSGSAFSLADSLKRQASAVSTAFSNANGAVAFTQVINVALSKQDEILDNVKSKLLYVKKDTTTDIEREIIREDVVSLLNKFDEIASDSNYNKQYYLQKSNDDNSTSLIFSFQISEIPSVTLSTDSIQSNTQGLGLTTLKNLSTDELTDTAATTQSGIVDTAITSIESFQDKYKQLQGQFKLAVSSLDSLHSNLKTFENDIRTYDYAKDSASFDKSSILSKFGSLATSQANATSSVVSSLLNSINSAISSYATSQISTNVDAPAVSSSSSSESTSSVK